MELIEKFIDLIISNFDFSYMITINVLTYITIKCLDYVNKNKNVKTIEKRIALLASIVAVTSCYLLSGYKEYIVLLNSAICAPVFYSWVLRPILIKFNIAYKQYDETLN